MAAKRFQWAIDRESIGPLSAFDIDLYEFSSAGVCPTIGSIVPGWLLIVPRFEVSCFASLATEVRFDIRSHLDIVREDISIFDGKPWIFEHGARFCGSATGCGVDQAHLHVVPLKFDLIDAAERQAHALKWIEVNSFDPWAEIDSGREYYFVSDSAKSYVAYPDAAISQFFRRVIANKLGCAAEWDYRLFSHERNAAETTRRLRTRSGQRLAA